MTTLLGFFTLHMLHFTNRMGLRYVHLLHSHCSSASFTFACLLVFFFFSGGAPLVAEEEVAVVVADGSVVERVVVVEVTGCAMGLYLHISAKSTRQ